VDGHAGAPLEGLRGSAHMTVGEQDTAVAVGSGDVPVLATPRLAALIEQAAVAALRDALDEGRTSVGTGIHVDHVSPTPVGGRVHAQAVLQQVNGRHLRFEVQAWDEHGAVAHAVHHRAVVDRERFLRRAKDEQPQS
jgi:predicted thioesterase